MTLNFYPNQVVTGGQYDVDVTVESPNKVPLYRQVKSQYDTFSFVTKEAGDYSFCFSNEFSTFSHKVVYMDLQVGDEPALPHAERITVMTMVSMFYMNTRYMREFLLRNFDGRTR